MSFHLAVVEVVGFGRDIRVLWMSRVLIFGEDLLLICCLVE